MTIAETDRKLDVAIKSICTWMEQEERGKLRARLGASKLTPDQQRICELERELATAKSGYQNWSAGKVVPPRKLEEMRLLVAIKAAHQRGCGI